MTSSPLSEPHTAPPGCPAHRPSAGTGSDLPKLYDDDFAADPNALYDRLRSQGGPAQWVELAPGVESILVTGYQANIVPVSAPPERFGMLYDEGGKRGVLAPTGEKIVIAAGGNGTRAPIASVSFRYATKNQQPSWHALTPNTRADWAFV